jgi:hypothetical protein
VDGPTAGGRTQVFLLAAKVIHSTQKEKQLATKAEQIWEEINERVAAGTTKADAFKALAEEYSQPVDSIRGSYYSYKKKVEGGESRPRTRRRTTTPEDALADARAAFERAIASIDKEVETAKERAKEAAGEYEEIRGSAEERKAEITKRCRGGLPWHEPAPPRAPGNARCATEAQADLCHLLRPLTGSSRGGRRLLAAR